MKYNTIKVKNTIACIVFFVLLSAIPLLALSQTCKTKIECVRESIEEKRKRIESGEIDTTPSSTHEYTHNVEYRFRVSEGDTVWDEIRDKHDALTPDPLEQWFENERMAVLRAFEDESELAIRYMGFSSGSIDRIYPGEHICFKALHRSKRVIEEGEVIQDTDVVYDIKTCK